MFKAATVSATVSPADLSGYILLAGDKVGGLNM